MSTEELLLKEIRLLRDEISSMKSFLFPQLSAKDAAQKLNIHVNTLYKKVEEGAIKATQTAKRGQLTFSLQDLEQYCKNNTKLS